MRIRGRFAGLNLSLMLGLALPALLLSWQASGDGVFDLDVEVARFVQRFPDPPFGWIADFGNWAGSARVGVPMAVGIAIALAVARQFNLAAIAALAAVTRLLNGLLKQVLDSPRPTSELVRVTEIADGLGFPSGHAMGSMLWYGALFVIAGRLIAVVWLRRLLQAAAIAVIIATGFGRIYSGAHWPSDVFGGYLWGLFFLLVVVALVDLLVRPLPSPLIYSPSESSQPDV